MYSCRGRKLPTTDCGEASVIAVEAIAHTRYCKNEARKGGVWLNFAAQLSYIDMKIVGFCSIAGTPHLGE